MSNDTSVQLCHQCRNVSLNTHNCAACRLTLRFAEYIGRWPPAPYAVDADECRNGGYKVWDSYDVWGGESVVC